MEKKTSRVHIRIDSELKHHFDSTCEMNNKKPSEIIRQLLNFYISRHHRGAYFAGTRGKYIELKRTDGCRVIIDTVADELDDECGLMQSENPGEAAEEFQRVFLFQLHWLKNEELTGGENYEILKEYVGAGPEDPGDYII